MSRWTIGRATRAILNSGGFVVGNTYSCENPRDDLELDVRGAMNYLHSRGYVEITRREMLRSFSEEEFGADDFDVLMSTR